MKKLLIVDDEVFSRTAIEDSIKASDQSIEVFGAANGEEALKILKQVALDVIMTDIKMPVMDGMELLAEIRKLEMNVEVIILSSYNEFELARKAIQLGAFDYLFKPAMLPENIIEVVHKAFDQQNKSAGLVKTNERRDGNGQLNEKGKRELSLEPEMKKAIECIKNRLGDKNLSLQMIADHIGLSKNYFSRMFKETMGTNFIDYITRLRVEKAKELYVSTDMKIYEIAELVGYSDWHYLYNVYKKYEGHSLSQELSKK